MKTLFLVFGIFLSGLASADEWKALAECATPDNVSGGVYLGAYGNQLILQVAKAAESMDEYRTNLGAVTKLPIDIDAITSALEKGEERSLVFSKATATEAEGDMTGGATLTLKLGDSSQTSINGVVNRRGRVMLLVCKPPVR